MRIARFTLSLIFITQFFCAPIATADDEGGEPKPVVNFDFPMDMKAICKLPEYPAAAVRRGIEGDTKLTLHIDEHGKIAAFDLLQSAGWKILDMSIMNHLSGCQLLPPGNYAPQTKIFVLHWQYDHGYSSRAELDLASCKKSASLRIAQNKDIANDIVVGVMVSSGGKVVDAIIQWGSGDEALDKESLRIARSCEFFPAEYQGKRVAKAESLRFIGQND